MATYLYCVKKPSALPLLKGTATGWCHLDPVGIVTGDAGVRDKIRNGAPLIPVDYFDGLSAAMIRATKRHTDHVWIRLPDSVSDKELVGLLKPSMILTPDGRPALRAVATLSAAAFSKAEQATFEDRNADSVIDSEKTAATILNLKA